MKTPQLPDSIHRVGLTWVVATSALAMWSQATLGDDAAQIPSTVGLSNTYALRVVTERVFPVKTTHGMIEGQNPKRSDLETYIPVLIAEWNIYPKELVRKTKLRAIVLCSRLEFAGQPRTAIPDFGDHTLYLDVSRGRNSEAYTRKVMHHEFFHIIDYQDDGRLYVDDEWSLLNPVDFQYGSGGASVQNVAGVSALNTNVAGFLNDYSLSGVEEDKAEIFANMIVDSEVVNRRITSDRLLHAKCERMKAVLLDFCPQMDESFWTKARLVTRKSTVTTVP